MYSSKFAIAVKSSGKVLREIGDTVYLPFGIEYEIFIKNLNSVRARVRIEVDGKNIADDNSFIIAPNSSTILERFLRNGNLLQGNRFKFIERTSKVEEHRDGPQVEDGLIRVIFEFERENIPPKQYCPTWQPTHYGPDYYYRSQLLFGSAGLLGVARGITANTSAVYPMGASASLDQSSSGDLNCRSSLNQETDRVVLNSVVNTVGITAAGSVSDQKFTRTSDINGDGVEHVIILKLLGEVGQKKIKEPLTVKSKPKCTTCGRTNKSSSKFCVECGGSLMII